MKTNNFQYMSVTSGTSDYQYCISGCDYGLNPLTVATSASPDGSIRKSHSTANKTIRQIGKTHILIAVRIFYTIYIKTMPGPECTNELTINATNHVYRICRPGRSAAPQPGALFIHKCRPSYIHIDAHIVGCVIQELPAAAVSASGKLNAVRVLIREPGDDIIWEIISDGAE